MELAETIHETRVLGRVVVVISHPIHKKVMAAGLTREEAVGKCRAAIARLDG